MDVRLEVTEGTEVFRAGAEGWGELLSRTRSPSFFLRPDWLDTWAQHFGAGRRLFLAVAFRGDRAIGGLPLCFGLGKVGRRFKAHKLECAGAPLFDRMEIPAADYRDCKATLSAIFDWAVRELKGWTAFCVDEVPNGSDTHRALQEVAGERGLALHDLLASRAPMVDLEKGGETSSKYRRQLRQSLDELCARGALEMDFFYVRPEQVDALVAECKTVEDSSWKGEEGVGVFREGAVRSFYTDLWRLMTPRGDIALGTVRLDGRLIIYHWGFRHHDRFLSYNLAQVPDTNEVRGGSVLLRYMVEHGRELGFRVIDASRGSLLSPNIIGRYHGPIREHGDFTLYSPTLRGKTLSFVRHSLFPLARKALKKPEPAALPAPAAHEQAS